MTDEIFKPIPGFPEYEVSNMGIVRSFKKKDARTLKPCRDKDGYLTVTLTTDGKPALKRVHQLVMLAFVGPRPDGLEVCHGPDSDKANNRLDNLRYDTHRANMQEFVEVGSRRFGRFTKEEIRGIIEQSNGGSPSAREIAEYYKVSRNTIYSILRRYRIKVLRSNDNDSSRTKSSPLPNRSSESGPAPRRPR